MKRLIFLLFALAILASTVRADDPPCHGSCVADFDDGTFTGAPDGGVTIDDYLYFLYLFSEGDPCADIDDGTWTATPDGGVTIDDLIYMFGSTHCC